MSKIISPENEQQTERQKKSTAKSQNRIVEPAIFYSNTIDFNYDFWEFANRSIANPFMIRFEHSEVLYNNLYNNNNKSPIQNIQCRFSAFKQLIKVGNFQGQVNLLWDIDNWFNGVCSQGTYFYDKLEELFKPWQPRYKTLQSFTHGDTFNSGVGIGEEEVEIIEEDKEEVVGEYDKGKAHVSYDTYFRTEDESLFNAIAEGLGIASKHTTYQGRDTNWNKKAPNDKNAACWGCVIGNCEGKEIPLSQGGTVYTYFDQDQSEEILMELPTDQEYILKVGNGQFIVKTKEEVINSRFKFERIKQEKEEEYKTQEFDEPIYDDNNTQFASNIGEVDPHELPSLDKDTETKETNEEKEQKLTEKGGDTEKLFEKQQEIQRELERVREIEKQLERELEREKEKEREKERDLEKEKLQEKEKQAERERKQRETQWEQEKKEKERLDRETRTRERIQQREQERKEKDKKDKEKKAKE